MDQIITIQELEQFDDQKWRVAVKHRDSDKIQQYESKPDAEKDDHLDTI